MSLIAEINRRNVAKVAVLYVVASWLILQVADVGVSLLELPDWVGKTIFLFLVLGFPFALIFSWVYELTPEGLKREKEIDRSQSITHETGRKINILIVVLLIAAIATVLFDRFIPRGAEKPAAPVATESGTVTETEPSQLAAAKFAPAPDRSIAVLPFADMSPDQDQAYFSDGLSEELLNLLANVPELQVASRTSAFSFKGKEMTIADMAAQLNVARQRAQGGQQGAHHRTADRCSTGRAHVVRDLGPYSRRCVRHPGRDREGGGGRTEGDVAGRRAEGP